MGRCEEALAGFNRAIDADPDLAWAIAGRAAVHKALGEYDKALDDLTRAIALDPIE
jgi:tetratricopeptide (TPR) repeat protein